jgi:hypothetical protein
MGEPVDPIVTAFQSVRTPASRARSKPAADVQFFRSGSISISCHRDNQPMVRGIAKSTVNISGLNPIA